MSEEVEYAFYFDEEKGEVSIIGLPEITESDVYPDGQWVISADKNGGMPYTKLMPNPDAELPETEIPLGAWRIDSTRNDGFPFTELMPIRKNSNTDNANVKQKSDIKSADELYSERRRSDARN